MAKVVEIHYVAHHTPGKNAPQQTSISGAVKAVIESDDQIGAALATVSVPAGFKVEANGVRLLVDGVTVVTGKAKPAAAPKKKSKK